MEKKLYKSRDNKVLCGVLGGLAKYLNIDATVLRVIYVLLSLFVLGCPVIIYFILALIIPQEPEIPQDGNNSYNNFNQQ